MEYGQGKANKLPLSIPLLSNKCQCANCGGKLLLRTNRPSRITLYTDSLGTVPATHFHKYCKNTHTCKAVQFYGYYKLGNGNIVYDADWMMLPYFISLQETGFEMSMLRQFDAELLMSNITQTEGRYLQCFQRL